MKINLIKKYSNSNFFIILLSSIILLLTYKYNLYKFSEAVNGPLMYWDGRRYLGPDNFYEIINERYFSIFSTYFLFTGLFKKFDLLNILPFFQFLIFHLSCFYFFKVIKTNHNLIIGYICWAILILNPIFFKWCHAANPLIITISLCLISLSLILSKKNNTIITFLILFLLLENDAKLIINYLILNYFFFKKIYNKINKKVFIFLFLLTFIIITNNLLILIYNTSTGFITFDQSVYGRDIIGLGASLQYLNPEIFVKCSLTEMNSIKNHICLIKNDFLYSIELYTKRFFYGLLWISPNWSLQYQILSKCMITFYYTFAIFGLSKNRDRLLLLSNFFAPFALTLPYILDGNQRFVTHAYIFITPIAGLGFYLFLRNFLKLKILDN